MRAEITRPPAAGLGALAWLIALLGLAAPAARAVVRDAPGIGLELWVEAKVQRADGSSAELPLEDGGVLRSGDAVRFRYRVGREAYVYLLAFGSSGAATLIDPISGAAEAARLAAGEERRVPADGGYLRLDETVGREVFAALAVTRPLDPISPLLVRIEGSGGDPEALIGTLEAEGAAFATVAVRHLGREPLIGVGPSVARRGEAPVPEAVAAPRPSPSSGQPTSQPSGQRPAPAPPTRLFPENDPYREPEVLGAVGSRIRALPVGGGEPARGLPGAQPGEAPPAAEAPPSRRPGEEQGKRKEPSPESGGGLLGKLGRLLRLGGGEDRPAPAEPPSPAPPVPAEPVARSYPLPGAEPEGSGRAPAPVPVPLPGEASARVPAGAPPRPGMPGPPPVPPLAGAAPVPPASPPSASPTSAPPAPGAPPGAPLEVLEPRPPGRIEMPSGEALAAPAIALPGRAELLEVPLPAGRPATPSPLPGGEGMAPTDIAARSEPEPAAPPPEPASEATSRGGGERSAGGLLSVLGSLLGGGGRAPQAGEEKPVAGEAVVEPALEPIAAREPGRVAGLAAEPERLPRPRAMRLAEVQPLAVAPAGAGGGEARVRRGAAPGGGEPAAGQRRAGGWLSSLLGGLLGRGEGGEAGNGAAREAAGERPQGEGGAERPAATGPAARPATRPVRIAGESSGQQAGSAPGAPRGPEGPGAGVLSGTGSKIAALLAGEEVPPGAPARPAGEAALPSARAAREPGPDTGQAPASAGAEPAPSSPIVPAPPAPSLPGPVAAAPVPPARAAGGAPALAGGSTPGAAPAPRVEPDPVQLALVREAPGRQPAAAASVPPSAALEPLARVDLRDPDDVSRAVVQVSTARGSAAGVLLDERGHVLTVWHAVRGMGSAAVIFRAPDDPFGDATRVLRARVERVNRFADLALLTLETVPEDVTPLRLAAPDAPATGAVLHVISQGRDGVWRHTVGKISAVRRNSSWYSGQRILHRATVLRGKVLDEPGNAGAALLGNDLELLALGAEDRLRNDRLTAIGVDTIRRFLAAGSGDGGGLAGGD